MKICIYGASSARLDAVYYEQAEKLGYLMAQAGHSLVFGGGKEGLMGAVARGVHSAGGGIIGIAPKFFDEPGVLYEHCTQLLFTETMRERKQLMEEQSSACIVLPGGIGTYEEFFEMLTLKQLGKTDRAIAILNTEGYYAPMQAMLEATAQRRFMSENCMKLYHIADTPEDALSYIDNYIPQGTGSIKRLSDYNK